MIDTERLKTDAAYWDGVAPLGATHYWEPSGEWYQDCGDYALSWSFGAGKWLQAVLPLRIARPEAIPCPTKTATPEWNGFKALETGMLCWWLNSKAYVEWTDCYHAVLRVDGLGIIFTDKVEKKVKPIRTKEQKLREELMEVIPHPGFNTKEQIAHAILVAGYRKPEND